MDEDALLAEAAALAARRPGDGGAVTTTPGGFDVGGGQPDEAKAPPAEPTLPQPSPPARTEEKVMMLGVPDPVETPANTSGGGEGQARKDDRADSSVPLRVALKIRDEMHAERNVRQALEAEVQQLRRYKQDTDQVLDEVRSVYPTVREKALKAEQYEADLKAEQRRIAMMREKLVQAKDRLGEDFGFDEVAFEKELKLERALDSLSNIDAKINAALAAQFDAREARYNAQSQEQYKANQHRAAQVARDNFFSAQMEALEKSAPGIKRYARAIRAEFENDPSVPISDIAAPLVETLSMRAVAARSTAQGIPRTTGGAPAARSSAVIGASPETSQYRGKTLREIIALRKSQLGVG